MNAGALRVALVVLVIALALRFDGAGAQPPIQATDRVAAMEQLVRDLHDHRDWVEQQLAAAKAVNTDLQRQLTEARAKCPPPPADRGGR